MDTLTVENIVAWVEREENRASLKLVCGACETRLHELEHRASHGAGVGTKDTARPLRLPDWAGPQP